jgi:dsDNA-specific endonuclease/ATPase MutS2
MVRQAFRDPKVFWAYIGTKMGVFAVAAIATWPLARLIGPKTWIGLGVFGGLLAILTLAVLFGASTIVSSGDEVDQANVDGDDEEPVDPDTPVEIPVEDSIDLHPFPPRDVPDVVDAYLEVAIEEGFTEVRLIHGRGIGVQRDRVQKLLARHPLVSGFHDAPADRGGWGATIAYLKRKL